MATMESNLKQIRIIWSAMFVAGIIYVWLPEMLHVQPRELNPVIYPVLVGLALMDLVVAVVIRNVMLGRATDALRLNATDTSAQQKWRAAQILTVAVCESIVLFGLVLRFLGATRVQSVALYVVGLGAMIVFWPKAPE